MDSLRSDEFLSIVVPLVASWVYSGFYELLGGLDEYRLHSRKEEETNNLVPKHEVIKRVILQQSIQASITLILFKVTGGGNEVEIAKPSTPITVVAAQFVVAMLVFDTWQYFVHRCMHLNKFLYRNFHSWHHRLAAPYAYAAQYNHPVDALLTETLAGALAFFVSGMSPRTSIFFFTFATLKGIDDHCGMMLPWNPFHLLFGNNTAYHEIHHQLGGSKSNFGQAFFVMWDKLLGTYAPYQLVKREGGGYEARIANAASG